MQCVEEHLVVRDVQDVSKSTTAAESVREKTGLLTRDCVKRTESCRPTGIHVAYICVHCR